MSDHFAKKLELVLKVLSMSRARLAADLGVDKSVVGRWVSGAVQPSAHNLSLLSALVAERIPKFTALDWDRGLRTFAELIGANIEAAAGEGANTLPGLPLARMDLFIAATELRGEAYEGFYRTTRPYVLSPGRFVHDHAMVRRDPNGLLRLSMATSGTVVDGWVLPVGNQLFAICIDVTSGAILFGIFNGVGTARADVVDGLVLAPALDAGRTPTAHVMSLQRIGDLSGDHAADDQRFKVFGGLDPVIPENTVSEDLRQYLTADIGPAAAAKGGDLLLRLPLSKSRARGPAYKESGKTDIK